MFVTAHQDYAVQAFSVDGFDYLLKPVSEERLGTDVAGFKAARRGSRRGAPTALRWTKVPVRRRGKAVLLDPDDIFWAEANGDALAGRDLRRGPAVGTVDAELEDLLPSARFFRIHRRHLVNLQRVVRLELAESGRWVVHLTDSKGTVIEVARRQTRALKQHLGLR